MTAAECHLCGGPPDHVNGNGYLCADCTRTLEDGVDPDGSTEPATADTSGERASVESVPTPLADLGAVFVPIEPREKGTRRPRTDEHLYAPDDPVLEAYLEAGHNYGVACRDDLAVLDADDPDALADVIDAIPETAWQVSGSGEGEHYFLQVPGLDADLPLDDPETGENVGHVKGAEQSYVVGPGSVHPSGNRYGPLQGDTLSTITETELRDILGEFLQENTDDDAGELFDTTRPRRTNGPARTGDTPLDIYDVLSRARYPEETRVTHPFHGSETGANFMVDGGGETWACWRNCGNHRRGVTTGNALHLVGIEQGVIDCGDWIGAGVDTDTWREIFAAAREAGYDLPEFDPTGKPVAVLPTGLAEWDWRRSGQQSTLSIEDAHVRTQEKIADAYRSGDHALVEALPTLGKSYGAVAAAADTDEPVTILTGRGRKEQYAQFREWCREHGLEHYTLPAFTHDCDTANGEHGAEWAETVRDWYHRGATPQDIHAYAADVLGRPLPCQTYEGQECPYAAKWDFDPETYDVLIGHYSHAHKTKVTKGRTLVFDEFPGSAYETFLDHGLAGAVTYCLQCHEELPFEDYADLQEGRHDEARRADALASLADLEPTRESRQALDDDAGHAAAPLAVLTLLAGAKNDLGNGWERADLGDGRIGLYDREADRVVLLQPSTDTYHRALVALDGTPTPQMWELVLGERLPHRQVLTDDERREYIRDVLNLQFVRTSEWVKPYNSAAHVNVDADAALLEAIADEHGQHPALITTSTAEHEYDAAGVLDRVADHEHYGNVLGSNKFAHTRLGAVIGSQHYGDRFIEKWGAFAGEAVTRNDGKGAALSYGAFGDQVLTHMREHETLQAAMRFGRDGNGAVVYVHTDTLPDWVPLAGEGRVLQTWSDGRRQVIEAASELQEWTTAKLAAHPTVEIGERQVRDHLHALAEAGHIHVEVDGCGYVWRDDGLHRVGDHGAVELASVDVDDLTDAESAELARSSTYTWEFRTSPPSAAAITDEPARTGATGGDVTPNGGDPPSNEAD